MDRDLRIDHDGGVVNIRAGAIILKDGKFLTVGNSRTDTLCPVFFNDRLRHPERSVNYFVTGQRK